MIMRLKAENINVYVTLKHQIIDSQVKTNQLFTLQLNFWR